MNAVQPPTRDALACLAISHPELPQLRQTEHAMLPGSQLGQLDIKRPT
jgi:hypothetical protein